MDGSDFGQLAYEARYKAWGPYSVVPWDRLPQENKNVWNCVAEAVATPMAQALMLALETVALAQATLAGHEQVRELFIADQQRLRKGLEAAIKEMERATTFVETRHSAKRPEGVALWREAIIDAKRALEPMRLRDDGSPVTE